MRPRFAGGDRKTLDAHMHLMEAYTALYECSRRQVHRRKLLEVIGLLMQRILHPQSRTGIPQFWADWSVAPQIKFDIIWGWDRFTGGEKKPNPTDNTSYGHNLELVWLLLHALDVLGEPIAKYEDTIRKIVDHAVRFGIDREHGGVFVEGSHTGPAWDLEKEFWQQAESLIALLDATLVSGAAALEGLLRCPPVRLQQDDPSRRRRVVAADDPRRKQAHLDPHEPLVEDQLPHRPLDDPEHPPDGKTSGAKPVASQFYFPSNRSF